MSSRILSLGLVLVLSASVSAQHRHAREYDHFDESPRPRADVSYVLQMTLIPDSSLARGMLETVITNIGDSMLASVSLDVMEETTYRYVPPRQRDSAWRAGAIPPERACVIDSILFRGVPCDREQVMIVGGAMTIEIDKPLQPGERGHFLMALTIRIGSIPAGDAHATAIWTDCWPRVTELSSQHDTSAASLRSRIEPADWRAQIALDSSYHLIHSGDLLNEKELYGTLPRPGREEVIVDVHENQPFMLEDRMDRPEFSGVVARYFIDAPAETDLVLIAARDLARDIAANEKQRFSVYYPRSRSASWERWLVSDLKRLAAALRLLLDWAPPTEMKAVVVPNVSQFASQSLILVPASSGSARTRARLALGIAGSGLRAPENQAAVAPVGPNLQRGFAVMMLYAAYGDNASSSIHLLMPSLIQETE